MSLTIRDFAKGSRIPKQVLLYLNREKIIQDPLCREDIIGLQLFEKVWGRKEVLRPQLRRMSMRARLNFIRTADLPSKWERYAYSRFRNHEQGKSLTMQTVIEEVEITFGFRLNSQQTRKLYKIRNRAQVARHREKNFRHNSPCNLLRSTNE